MRFPSGGLGGLCEEEVGVSNYGFECIGGSQFLELYMYLYYMYRSLSMASGALRSVYKPNTEFFSFKLLVPLEETKTTSSTVRRYRFSTPVKNK